ncbi:MAG: hypothetical protein GFH27_549445n6 [Chloroflexi bacterium AL-W]|nr:hypothetical protein [Chloroflexi bacterium AL-N1]NOK71662.1 hypothetical protein [Chloroflexi bacterium AL-N10]NOK79003.1 hypothetical protein [Chloroflexi bacterium AL-N5]NOK86437.1 hypothetical protein [Chloroflexi bacterium AL-W]NOK93403.1 hypothetical protein [Chloroflexi bacterium AL-N15]
MKRYYPKIIKLAILAMVLLILLPFRWAVGVASEPTEIVPGGIPSTLIRELPLTDTHKTNTRRAPGLTIEPYVRPEFAQEMQRLRPIILAAAHRHNDQQLSGMDHQEFAVMIALLLYNENFGSFEDVLHPVRPLTPFYQDLQSRANEMSGTNLSVWPANLRPSVALEMHRQQVPFPNEVGFVTMTLRIAGSTIDVDDFEAQHELYATVTQELTDPELAVEYLAANIGRGVYRAHLEEIPVTWRTLAAWHNQGIVHPRDIRQNATATDYVRRTSAYLDTARQLIYTEPVPAQSYNPDYEDAKPRIE